MPKVENNIFQLFSFTLSANIQKSFTIINIYEKEKNSLFGKFF